MSDQIIETWLAEQKFNFKVEHTNIHKIGDANWRVDIYKQQPSPNAFVRDIHIEKSYYLGLVDEEVTDLTLNA